MQEVVITPKTLSMLWRPKLYLGHIKSNSPTVTWCYVNGWSNSLKHCTGGRTVGTNNNKVLASFEWFRTTWGDHSSRLPCVGVDFQVTGSVALHVSTDLTRTTWGLKKNPETQQNTDFFFCFYMVSHGYLVVCSCYSACNHNGGRLQESVKV